MSFKFFRKYNKWLLPIGGSFLMVLFLIPQATNLFTPSRESVAVGELAGEEITYGDIDHASGQMRVIATLMPGITQFGSLHPYGLPQGENAEATWVMLRHLARESGVPSSRAQASQLLAGEGMGERIRNLSAEMKISEEAIRNALRDYLAVVTYKHLALGFVPPNVGPRLSEVGLRNLARSFGTSVDMEYVTIRADWFLDQVDPPEDEAVLRAHFEKYRDVMPGEGEYGFGYRLPWRVKLEFIAVPFDRVLEQVEVDEIEAREMFDQNPTQYAPEIPAEPGPDATDAEREAYREAVEAREAWEALSANEQYRRAREQIRRTMRERQAANRQREAIQFIESELRASLRDVPIDPETGLRRFDQAEDYQPIALSTLAEAIQNDDRFGFLPDVVRLENRFRAAEQIEALRGFGDSFLVRQAGGEQRRIPTVTADPDDQDYLSTLRQLEIPREQTPFDLQVGVPSLPVVDPAGTRYVFRVTDARPSEPPDSLDAVGDQVERDVMLLDAYERVRQQEKTYLDLARERGLSGLAERLDEETDVPVSVGSWTGISQQRLTNEMNRPFAREVFDQIVREVEEAGSLADAGDERRYGAVPFDPERSLYVMRVSGFQPVSAEQFARLRPALAQRWMQMDQFEMLSQLEDNPFSYEQLKARTGYREMRGGEASDSEQSRDQPPASDDGSNDQSTESDDTSPDG